MLYSRSGQLLRLRPDPSATPPLITILLIGANLLAFWYAFTLGESRLVQFLDLWGIVPQKITSLLEGPLLQPAILVTPLTSMYLHVGLVHLVTNMLYLWVFGAAIERQLGHSRFLGFYTLCGLLAAVVQVVAWRESAIPAIGASGAIAGLLGAYLVLKPGATVAALAPFLFFFPSVDVPAVLMLGLWCLSQVIHLIALLSSGTWNGSGALLAHIGGFAAGLVLVCWFRPARRRANWASL